MRCLIFQVRIGKKIKPPKATMVHQVHERATAFRVTSISELQESATLSRAYEPRILVDGARDRNPTLHLVNWV